MTTYRGNLKETHTQSGEGRLKPPAGKSETFERGGDVEMRGLSLRSKAEEATIPRSGSGKVGSLPGKAFTGRGGAKKGRGRRRFTAEEAAAILGKRG